MKLQLQDFIKEDMDLREIKHAAAWGDLDGFTRVDERNDEPYKDTSYTTTYLCRDSDGTYWSYNWDKYVSHYGCGEHNYWEDFMTQVAPYEETIVVKKWQVV